MMIDNFKLFIKSFNQLIKSQRFLKCVLVFLFFVIIASFSGYVFAKVPSNRSVFNIALLIFTVILVCYGIISLKIPSEIISSKKQLIKYFLKNIIREYGFYYLIVIFFGAFIAVCVNADFSSAGIKSFVTFFSICLFSFSFTKIIPFQTFIKVYRKIFPWIVVVSLLFYGLTNILKIDFPIMTISTSKSNYNNYLFTYFSLSGLENRNCSIFWEPATYSIFISLGLIFEIVCSEQKIRKFVILIYLAAIVTTMSSTGFLICFLAVLISILAIPDKHMESNYKFLMALIIVFSVVLITVVIVDPSIFLKFSLNYKGTSLYARLYSPYINMRMFVDHPFGVGFTKEPVMFFEYASNLGYTKLDSQTCTFGYWMSAFGVFGILMLLIPVCLILLNERMNIFVRIFIVVFAGAAMMAEPLEENMVLFIMIFYCINSFAETRKKCVDVSNNESLTSIKETVFKDNNNSIFIKNSLGSFVVKGIAMIISLVTTSSYISYFCDPKGDGMLALWFTILSLLTWILVFDIGIGNGLKNKLISSYENKDDKYTKKLISSSYISVFLISLCIFAVLSLLVWTLDFYKIFNISTTLISDNALRTSLFIIVLSICLNFVLKLVGNIYESLQKQWVSNLLAVFNTLILMIFVVIARFDTNDSRLIGLSVAYLFASTLPPFILTIILFSTKFKSCKLSYKEFSLKTAKEVTSLGGMFFAIQICMLVIVSTNTLITQQLFGNSQIGATAQYTYYDKIYNIVIIVAQLLSGPLWAIIAKAKSSSDKSYILKANKMIFKLSILFIIVDLLIFLCLPIVFQVWIPDADFEFSWTADAFFGLSSIVIMIAVLFTSISNGLSLLKYQVAGFILGAIIKIVSVVIIAVLLNQGVNVKWYYVALTTALAYVPVCILVPIGNNKYIKNKQI